MAAAEGLSIKGDRGVPVCVCVCVCVCLLGTIHMSVLYSVEVVETFGDQIKKTVGAMLCNAKLKLVWKIDSQRDGDMAHPQRFFPSSFPS